ncbi:DUF799 domain-containing protein [Pseudomonas sp. HR1]|uniref:DUF799 domain-containing protein n=1 Tax=Pseudomonas TaxID=286 RepID=UPI001472A171|nr:MULTISPECIES: DUF799 domain-containing protein [Pseudomonas]MDK4198285.1 DUF799 domain-containing protein [Pseudomonas sp. HR1]NMZ65926.1 DUF799 domain-containing protein [Pseudomonas oryzihabitans]
MPRHLIKALTLLATLAFLGGCANQQKVYDYTAFRESKPASVVILPPVNKSPDIKASYSVLAQLSYPLGEAGYYVLPVALVDETFKQNGLLHPDEMQAAPPPKLREIFGADAALYTEVTRYGTSYHVISSETAVVVTAKLVDLRSGKLLWEGAAAASTAEQQQNSGGGLVGMLITAAVTQIVNSINDRGHEMAGIAGVRLLTLRPNGVLPGPHSPLYGKDLAAR